MEYTSKRRDSSGYNSSGDRASGGRLLGRKDSESKNTSGALAGSPSKAGLEKSTSLQRSKSDGRSSALGTSSFFTTSRQPASSSKPLAKSPSLNQTAPAAAVGMLRNTGRVSSYRNSSNNSSGVAAALGSSLSFGAMRTKSSTPPVEHELVMGEVLLGYGSSSMQGQRNYQEDTVAFLHTPTILAGAVYDGHGGDEVSKELEKTLLGNIHRGIAEISSGSSSGAQPSPAASSASSSEPNPMQISEAIATAYAATNLEMCNRLDAAAEAGSCAVTTVVTRAQGGLWLFCANAGDCRAVLYTGPGGAKRAVRLSEDHKPQPNVCPAEIERVCSAGGCVLWGRVQGCLAVSRAFGDKMLQPYVIADPYVTCRPLNPDQDSFMFLASDGVTDLLDDATACQIVADQFARGCNAGQAAAALVTAAYQRGSSDNISAVVMRIRRKQ